MKRKTLLVGTLVAGTLAGGIALAAATGHGPGGHGHGFMQGHGPVGAGHERMRHGGPGGGMGKMRHAAPARGHAFADPAKIEALKGELRIVPAQDAAWTKYAKAVQDAAAAMKEAHEGVDRDAVRRMGPAERSAFATRMREGAMKQMETVRTAAEALVAGLDETQKAKARQILPGYAFGPGAMHRETSPRHRH